MAIFSRETDSMLRDSWPQSRHQSHQKNKICLCFCLGFILSAILTMASCGLAYYIWNTWKTDNALPASLAAAEETNATFPESTSSDPVQNSAAVTESTTLSLPSTTDQNQLPSRNCSKRIIAYYAPDDSEEISKSQLSKLTHLILTPEVTMKNGSLSFVHDSGEFKFARAAKIAREMSEPPVVLFSFLAIQHYGVPFSDILTDIFKTRALIDGIVSFIQEYQLDGVDIYLESVAAHNDLLFLFSRILRRLLTRLATFVGRKTPYIVSGLVMTGMPPDNFDEISKHFDFLTISTISHYFPRPSFPAHEVGPSSPLYSKLAANPNNNVDYVMKNFSCLIGQSNKLNVMVQFGGNYWKNVITPVNSSDTLWMTAEYVNGKIEGGQLTRAQIQQFNSTVLWNDDSKTPYIWIPEDRIYIVFENERSLEEKMKYIGSKNIGGIAVFHAPIGLSDATMFDVLGKNQVCSGNDETDMLYKCD